MDGRWRWTGAGEGNVQMQSCGHRHRTPIAVHSGIDGQRCCSYAGHIRYGY